jgi:hypothetical protein
MFDTISFKVYGENIPMVILLNLFGSKKLEALIEQGALKFILWNQMLTYMVDNVPGLDPLQHGTYNTPAHSDPEESIKLGFNWLTKQLRTSDKKNLTRKIRDIYSLPDAKLSEKAVDLSKSVYESGKLKPYGLTPEASSFRDLDVNGRKKLCHCAEEILQYSHLVNNNMTSYSKFEFYQIFDDSNNKIHKAANLQRDFNKLNKLENIPDLQILFPEVSDPFKKIIKLRNKSSSKKFRTWISECHDSASGIEITKEYIDAIVNSKGFFSNQNRQTY